MRHFHFKYLRNIILVFIALVFAGYPYVLISYSTSQTGSEFLIRGIAIMVLLLLSFSFVAYLAHVEHKKREKEETEITPEEPPSPRGF